MAGIGSSKVFSGEVNSYQRNLIPAPQGLETIDFGFSEIMADSLWLRAIQDIDYCDKKVKENQCQKHSWLFTILKAASDLSPKFEIIYNGGGLALSVLVSDVEGASIIFEKGVKEFPKNADIANRAGYHAMYEEKNPGKAANYLIISARNGGPDWFYSLAQRLYLKDGQRELGLATLRELKKQPDANAKLIKRLEARMEEFELDLKKDGGHL